MGREDLWWTISVESLVIVVSAVWFYHAERQAHRSRWTLYSRDCHQRKKKSMKMIVSSDAVNVYLSDCCTLQPNFLSTGISSYKMVSMKCQSYVPILWGLVLYWGTWHTCYCWYFLLHSAVESRPLAWALLYWWFIGPAEPVHFMSVYKDSLISASTTSRINVHSSFDSLVSVSLNIF